MTTMDCDQIAADFNKRYEIAWKEHGPAEFARLYAEEAMLVGYVTAIGHVEIAELLRGVVAQGWTGIKITTRHARRLGDVILVASDYTATKSDAEAGRRWTPNPAMS